MRVEPQAPAAVLAAVRAPLAGGAQPVNAPILQPLGLLLDLAGEGLRARLFAVQSEGGEEACLRPDFTVAVARSHLAAGQAAGRYYYEGPAFRAAPRGDQAEEFLQVGIEAYDAAGAGDAAEADAAMAAAAWAAAEAGGRSDLTLWLGDVALFAAFVQSLGLAPPLAQRIVRAAGRPRQLQSELARAGQASEATAKPSELVALLASRGPEAAGLLEEIWALSGVERVGRRGPAEIAERLVRRAQAAEAPALTPAQAEAIGAFAAIEDAPEPALAAVGDLGGAGSAALAQALDAWRRRLDRLQVLGAPSERMRFATGLGHAFAYYDGLTFEVRSDALGADRPVAVGGRYDGLLRRLGGADGQAVGCMVRPWRAWSEGEA